MRTIKFRGKRLDNNEWVYGSLTTNPYDEEDVEIVDHSSVILPRESVIPDSVGEYIGEKDCQGTEIYEGDIISVNGRYLKLVKFREDKRAFCMANVWELQNEDDWDIWQVPDEKWWNKFTLRVEGNCYDNPGLLKYKP